MTSVRPNLLPRSILMGLMLIVLFGVSSCKLEENKLQATIYPKNGATHVPVNTVIEIQYPKELGLKDDQMKSGLFSIHECEVNDFNYLAPQLKQNTTPATDPATAPTEEKTASNDPAGKTADKSTNAETQFKSEVKFFHMHRSDASETVFNYLVINPNNQESPLKPATTYCVKTGKIKNAKGETIGPKEISFTTEETPSVTFETKINPEFFGKRLAPSAKDASGQWQRDYILVNFRNQAVNPTDIKSQVKLCLANAQSVSTVEACKEFGKEIPFDIYLIEGLQNQDNNMLANYSLYAITPRIKLEPEQQLRIVVNLDIDKSAEANVGFADETIDVDNDPTLSWKSEYLYEIKGENNQPIASANHRFFFVGSGS